MKIRCPPNIIITRGGVTLYGLAILHLKRILRQKEE
jgi:hypothetical protein